jgi:hypothetical protein
VPDGVVDLDGKRHEILVEARDVVRAHGFELSGFAVIAATLRNPYDLEVSRYTHFHRPWVAGRGGRSWEIAMNEDFTEFARQSRPHRGKGLEHWFVLDGSIPENMLILRFERLAEDMHQAITRAGIDASVDIPHRNASRHDHFASYYTKEAEEIVYQKYKWAFDQGFYERLDVDDAARTDVRYGQKLPLEGPVVQVGPSNGLWPDLWVGERLEFRIKATEPVTEMTVSGTTGLAAVSLTATVDGRSIQASHEGDFAWSVPCVLGDGARADIRIVAEPVTPLRGESGDRSVSFALRRISFENGGARAASSRVSA